MGTQTTSGLLRRASWILSPIVSYHFGAARARGGVVAPAGRALPRSTSTGQAAERAGRGHNRGRRDGDVTDFSSAAFRSPVRPRVIWASARRISSSAGGTRRRARLGLPGHIRDTRFRLSGNHLTFWRPLPDSNRCCRRESGVFNKESYRDDPSYSAVPKICLTSRRCLCRLPFGGI